MSKELSIYYNSGANLYALLYNDEGKVWNGSAFETYSSANWANYAIVLTENGASGDYFGDFPAAITTAGFYRFPVKVRAGGSPAEGDVGIAGGPDINIEWNGSSTVNADFDSTVAVVNLADTKLYLKITETDDDDMITQLINECSRKAGLYCGRRLRSASYTEFYNGSGRTSLYLKNFPVTAITSVYDDPDRGFGANYLKDSADYYIEKESGQLQLFNNGGAFNAGRANVKVVYVAGWSLDDMPHEIRQAVKQWIAVEYHRWAKQRFDIQSQTVGDRTMTYVVDEIPKYVAAVLDRFANPLGAPDFAFSS